VAFAFPDRVSRRRGGNSTGGDWLSVGGRGFRLDPVSPLAREEWLAVAEVSGAASGARILAAAPIDQATVESLFADRITSAVKVDFDPAAGSARTSRGRRLGAIQLSGGPDNRADPEEIEAALVEGVRTHGLALLPWSKAANALRRRADFARRYEPSLADLSDAALLASLDDWFPPLVTGKKSLRDIESSALSGTLDALLGWEGRKDVDRLAPSHFETPAGSRHAIDYEAEAGPTVEVRAQALFGLTEHPGVADGRVPLVLALTSPAGRPIQTTRDLPGFWRGSWASVAKEMRGRYPRHNWPDDPAAAVATLASKKDSRR
jgi:ATP-dependent helicase HrpB